MPNRLEKLISNLDRWVSLGDLFDENNLINLRNPVHADQ